MENEVVLKLTNLVKKFGDVTVLHGVSLELHEGEILGLVGENGAGKSTMMNILGGIYPKTNGEMKLFDQKYEPANPNDAIMAGIAFIQQELNLFTNLTIAENIFVDRGVDRKQLFLPNVINKRTKELLDRLNIDSNPNTLVGDLPMGQRQMVEIAKALAKDAKIFIFDEPTTSLSSSEKDTLFKLIREFSKKGISIIYISHVLDDVRNLCDEVLVIRDGYSIGQQTPISSISKAQIINRMVGREMSQIYPYEEKHPDKVILEVKQACRTGKFQNVSFDVHRGEIVGLLGLMGAGRTELVRSVYGVDPIDSGEICYEDEIVTSPEPHQWVKKGVAFVTENRREEGLLLPKNVSDNLELVNLPQLRKRLNKLDKNQQLIDTKISIDRLHIKTYDATKQTVSQISGGNQQKIVIGKWLLINPKMLILDEPTRGIDVGAKFEIYAYITQLALSGVGILFISSEMEELVGVCDRILVMCHGRLSGEVQRKDFTQDALMKLCIGETE